MYSTVPDCLKELEEPSDDGYGRILKRNIKRLDSIKRPYTSHGEITHEINIKRHWMVSKDHTPVHAAHNTSIHLSLQKESTKSIMTIKPSS